MTEKQKIFADKYLIDLNATRAYKVAYPRVKNDDIAAANASRLLRNAKVAAYISERMQERQKRTEVTQDRVIEELAAIAFAFKGKRSVGDAGNDYIAGLAWKFGQDVMTKFEWTMTSGAKLACDVVVNVTTPGGGDTTNIDALEFEVTCYGKPTYTPVVAA